MLKINICLTHINNQKKVLLILGASTTYRETIN